METIGIIGIIIGIILGFYRDNGKENGNYYSILGIYTFRVSKGVGWNEVA